MEFECSEFAVVYNRRSTMGTTYVLISMRHGNINGHWKIGSPHIDPWAVEIPTKVQLWGATNSVHGSNSHTRDSSPPFCLYQPIDVCGFAP